MRATCATGSTIPTPRIRNGRLCLHLLVGFRCRRRQNGAKSTREWQGRRRAACPRSCSCVPRDAVGQARPAISSAIGPIPAKHDDDLFSRHIIRPKCFFQKGSLGVRGSSVHVLRHLHGWKGAHFRAASDMDTGLRLRVSPGRLRPRHAKAVATKDGQVVAQGFYAMAARQHLRADGCRPIIPRRGPGRFRAVMRRVTLPTDEAVSILR